MSLFDLPRINFAGKTVINPPTANNNVFLPLVTFDPVNVRPVIPPRVYIYPPAMVTGGHGDAEMHYEVIHDVTDDLRYVEIKDINKPELFAQWMKLPLGSSSLDKHYHKLYKMTATAKGGEPLFGKIPAHWNYYGGMDFSLVETTVQSVVLSGDNGEPELVTKSSDHEIAEILGADFSLNNDRGQSTAVMVDVIPSLSFYSQIFCDTIQLKTKGKILLSGTPCKASLRLLNNHRILNIDSVLASSGTFFCTIAIEEISGGALLEFFQKHGSKVKKLRGIAIRFNLFEVFENQTPDYNSLGENGNPARSAIIGSISPWYEDEPRSISAGRLFLSENPLIGNKSLGPMVCHVDKVRSELVMDLSANLPENALSIAKGLYEAYATGPLKLKLNRNGVSTTIGTFEIGVGKIDRDFLIKSGGIARAKLDNFDLDQLEDSSLELWGRSKKDLNDSGTDLMLMKESEFMILSDQCGMYAEQNNSDPGKYCSYSAIPESCQVRVFKRGIPYKGELKMTIMQLEIIAPGAKSTVNEFMQTNEFKDKQEIRFPVDKATNSIYVLFPNQGVPPDHFMIPYILKTGFFLNLRVLPTHDYGRYLDPSHVQYPTPITFEVIRKELLDTYQLVFPYSSVITPFNEDYFRKGIKFMLNRMDPRIWNSFQFMPSSRDMSKDQYDLLRKWAETLPSNLDS